MIIKKFKRELQILKSKATSGKLYQKAQRAKLVHQTRKEQRFNKKIEKRIIKYRNEIYGLKPKTKIYPEIERITGGPGGGYYKTGRSLIEPGHHAGETGKGAFRPINPKSKSAHIKFSRFDPQFGKRFKVRSWRFK